MNSNLTPSEIAEIKNELFPELAEITRKAEKANGYSVFAKGSEKHTAFNEGYIAAACEYAAEIKRLREGIERLINGQHYTIHFESKEAQSAYNEALRNAKQLLNSQP